jgi:hypothetical protein
MPFDFHDLEIDEYIPSLKEAKRANAVKLRVAFFAGKTSCDCYGLEFLSQGNERQWGVPSPESAGEVLGEILEILWECNTIVKLSEDSFIDFIRFCYPKGTSLGFYEIEEISMAQYDSDFPLLKSLKTLKAKFGDIMSFEFNDETGELSYFVFVKPPQGDAEDFTDRESLSSYDATAIVLSDDADGMGENDDEDEEPVHRNPRPPPPQQIAVNITAATSSDNVSTDPESVIRVAECNDGVQTRYPGKVVDRGPSKASNDDDDEEDADENLFDLASPSNKQKKERKQQQHKNKKKKRRGPYGPHGPVTSR